jgi:hypothetical protein
MVNASRKAQYNSFAHHRANLLFSSRPAEAPTGRIWSATIPEITAHGTADASHRPVGTLRLRHVAGVLGFQPGLTV